MRNNRLTENTVSLYKEKLYNPSFTLLKQECKQLEIAFLNLINELKKINELIQNLTDCYKESHIIYLPVSIN